MDTFVPGDKVKSTSGPRLTMTVMRFIEDDDGSLAGYQLIDTDGRIRFYRHEDLKPAVKKKKRRRRKS